MMFVFTRMKMTGSTLCFRSPVRSQPSCLALSAHVVKFEIELCTECADLLFLESFMKALEQDAEERKNRRHVKEQNARGGCREIICLCKQRRFESLRQHDFVYSNRQRWRIKEIKRSRWETMKRPWRRILKDWNSFVTCESSTRTGPRFLIHVLQPWLHSTCDSYEDQLCV